MVVSKFCTGKSGSSVEEHTFSAVIIFVGVIVKVLITVIITQFFNIYYYNYTR